MNDPTRAIDPNTPPRRAFPYYDPDNRAILRAYTQADAADPRRHRAAAALQAAPAADGKESEISNLKSSPPAAAWMETAAGRRVDLPDPRPGQIDIFDIAHHLANQARFNGAPRRRFSVAQHSVLAADLARRSGYLPHVALAVLLHDAAEAYTGDIIRPIRVILGEDRIRALESAIMAAILRDLALPADLMDAHADEIDAADEALLATEADALMPGRGQNMDLAGAPVENLLTFRDGTLDIWPANRARGRYMGAYYRIREAAGMPAPDSQYKRAAAAAPAEARP